MGNKKIRRYCCWIDSGCFWLLAGFLLFPTLANCDEGVSRSPNGHYTVRWLQDASKDYHLVLADENEPPQEVKRLEFEYRRENLGIANYYQRKLVWHFNRFLFSEWYLTNEDGHGSIRLAGLGVLDAKTNAMLLNHEFNGIGKDATMSRWCFVKYRARSQRREWDPFEESDQLGLLSFHRTATKPDEGECSILWKELDGLVAANPRFSTDGKKIGVLIAKRLQPFCYILSSTDLKTISATPLRGLKLEKRYLTEVVGSNYSGFLHKTLKDDYGF